MERPSAFSHVSKARRPAMHASNQLQLPVSRAAKYGYSNARVSAMKSLLVKKELMNEFVRARSVDGMIEMLERTYYKENLVKLSMHYHGSELVQIASGMHFAEVVNKLERITPETDRKAFGAMLVKWDVVNAKTLLNARRLGKKYSEVSPFLIPIGSFTEPEAKGLVESSGESVYMKFAKTALGKRLVASKTISNAELEKLFLNFGSAEAVKLEAVLDSFAYSLCCSDMDSKDLEQIARIFKKEIDMKNATMILRLKSHGISDTKTLEKYFIKGGTKRIGSFAQLISAKNPEDGIRIAARQFELKGEMPTNPSQLEIALSRKLADAKMGAFYRSVLSVGTIIGFLFIKEEEINNLRKIAVGKEFGVPDEKILGMLVFN